MSRPAVGPRPVDRWVPVAWAGVSVTAAPLAVLLAGGLAGVEAPVLVGTAVTRSGMDAAGAACVGLVLLGLLMPLDQLAAGATREATRVQTSADRALVVAAGAWFGLVLADVAFRTAAAYGRPISAIGGAELVRFSGQLAAGRGLLLTAGCAAVVCGCGVSRLVGRHPVELRVPMVAALLGVLTPALTGHAGSAANHQIAVMTVAVHAAAAALWVGGLATTVALLARRRTLLDACLPRFSRLAGACLGLVGLTGVLNAAVRLSSWSALVTSGYGWLVIGKAAGLAVVGLLGAVTRRRLTAGRVPVLRWAGVEVTLMAVTLGLAAALTQSA